MEKYLQNELTIENISNTNIHHESITSSPIYSIIQLDSGVVAIGLENGIINFYHQDNFEVPYFNIRVDIYPIFSILQLKAPQLLCSSGSSMYLIYESESKKFTYEKVEKINFDNVNGNIHKILLLSDGAILSSDNKYISLFNEKYEKIKLIKQIKVNSPVIDMLLFNSSEIICAAPKKQSLIILDIEKFIQNNEIKDIKFMKDINCNNILIKIKNDLICIGGCLGFVYLLNVKNKQFIAKANLSYQNELITTMLLLKKGDLLCGSSLLSVDKNNENLYSSLAQYRYSNNYFKEIYRKLDIHKDIIRKIYNVINHRDIMEIATISLDKNFKIWN